MDEENRGILEAKIVGIEIHKERACHRVIEYIVVYKDVGLTILDKVAISVGERNIIAYIEITPECLDAYPILQR